MAGRRHRVSYHRQNSSGSEEGSPLSPGEMVTPPSSPSQECKGVSLLETPTRKNKRKLSEPRRRGGADFSVKRLCPDSPGGGSAMSESACSDDNNSDNTHHGGKDRHRRLSHDQDESSSRGGLSEREEDTPVSGLSSGLHAPVLPHPFFPSVAAAAATTCFVPGFYLGNGRAGFPPPAFAGLPLGLPPPPSAFPGAALDPRSGGKPRTGPLLKAQDLASRAESPETLSGDSSGGGGSGRKPRKNYKNMTRERRVEANARERTRVHTISAAFDALRRAVPSYSYNQKLSKLAILRIACTYIMALARLADIDCSAEPSVPLTFADCVDLCTRTIQTEGRARRRH